MMSALIFITRMTLASLAIICLFPAFQAQAQVVKPSTETAPEQDSQSEEQAPRKSKKDLKNETEDDETEDDEEPFDGELESIPEESTSPQNTSETKTPTDSDAPTTESGSSNTAMPQNEQMQHGTKNAANSKTADQTDGSPADVDSTIAPLEEENDSSSTKGGASTTKPKRESTVRTLDVITIIGNQQKLERASGSAYRLSNAQLESQEHDDVHRVLKQVPGVYIRDEDGFGLRPNIGLRGASSDRSAKVSLMEDGVLMAPAPYAAPAAYYFPLTTRLNGMEVYKGPAAIKYGPNTIGGAINFTTRPSVPRGTKGEIDLAMGSFGAQKVHLYFGQGYKGFGYILEGARLGSDGFKTLDGGGDTGFDKQDWMFKTHWQGGGANGLFQRLELKLGYAIEHSRETYLGLTDQDFEQQPFRRYRASALGEMKWDRRQIKIDYLGLIGDDIEWRIAVYRHTFERAWKKLNGFSALSGVDIHDAILAPENARYQPYIDVLKGSSEWTGDPAERLIIGVNDRAYLSQGVQAKLETTNRFGSIRNTLEVGARAHYDEINRDHIEAEYDMISQSLVRATDDKFVRQNTGTALAFSAYLFDELSWKNRIIISPGIRFEHYQLTLSDRLGSANTVKNQETIILPGAGAWYSLTDELGLLAGVHKGFSPVSPGQPENTQSETSLNVEAGLRWQSERFKGETLAFINQYENLTGTCTQSSGCDPNDLDTQFNAGRADIVGLEAVFGAHLNLGWGVVSNLQTTYTWTQTEFLTAFQSGFSQWGDVEKGDELPYVPTHQLSVSLDFIKSRFNLGINATFVSDMRDVAGQGRMTDRERIPAHRVVDLAAGYAPNDTSRLYLKVENVLNEAYMVSKRPFGARPGKPNQILIGFKQSL